MVNLIKCRCEFKEAGCIESLVSSALLLCSAKIEDLVNAAMIWP